LKGGVTVDHRFGGTASGAATSGGPTGLFFLQLSEQYLTSSKFFHLARSCMIRLQVTQYLNRFQTPDRNTVANHVERGIGTMSFRLLFKINTQRI
jgi:hypothetical protein